MNIGQLCIFVLIAIVAASDAAATTGSNNPQKCDYGESRIFVQPHCVPSNTKVTIRDNWPYCGNDPCYTPIDENEACPRGSERGTIKSICVANCQPPRIILRAKPYCVTKGCEANSTFAFCVSNQLKKVLDSDSDRCPEGSERGQQQHVCFDENQYIEGLCGPGDREHVTGRFPPYCVPKDFEKNVLAPLQRMTPICANGQPCLQLNRMMPTCPAGTELGKRQLRCNILPNVSMCGFGLNKLQVPPYCVPDTGDFHFSPYCSKCFSNQAINFVTSNNVYLNLFLQMLMAHVVLAIPFPDDAHPTCSMARFARYVHPHVVQPTKSFVCSHTAK